MMGKRGYVSRGEGSGSEGETGKTWDRSSERNNCVLIWVYSYGKNIAM
jgi:hypothetical protein